MSECNAGDRRVRKVYCVMGLPFDAVTMSEVLDRIHDAVANRRRLWITTPNTNFVVNARMNTALRTAILASDLSLADGTPVLWVARLLGIPLPERVSGAGLIEALRADQGRPLNVYFFGGPPGAAERAAQVVNCEAGGLRCVGFQSPGFGSVEELSAAAHLDPINDAKPDFLVVALPTVKGQEWILRNAAKLAVPVIACLGAVVNFTAGTVRRAPIGVQCLGAEWLWRIAEEPALWRRYASDAVALARIILVELLPLRLALSTRRTRGVLGIDRSLRVEVEHEAIRVRVAHEPWSPQELDIPRVASRTGQSIRVDLDGVAAFQSRALGELLLLEGRLCREGHTVRLTRLGHLGRRDLVRWGAQLRLD